VKESTIDVNGTKCAWQLSAALRMLNLSLKNTQRVDVGYDLIEVMACPVDVSAEPDIRSPKK